MVRLPCSCICCPLTTWTLAGTLSMLRPMPSKGVVLMTLTSFKVLVSLSAKAEAGAISAMTANAA